MIKLDAIAWRLITLLVVLLIALVLCTISLIRLQKRKKDFSKKILGHESYEELQDLIDDALGEKGAYKDLIHGSLSQVDTVFFTYLSSSWGGDFTRTERISNLVHYEVRYGPKTAFKFEMLLRSGYNDVTLLCWSLHPVPQSSLASEQAAALFEDAAFYATTAHIALFIGMFYMDQLRLLTLANLYRSRSLDQAIDRYFEINDHMQAEGRIRRRFFQMYEEESDRIDKLIATWREEAANADPHLIKGIGRPPELSALVDKAEQSFDGVGRPRGRPRDPEYDAIYRLFDQGIISQPEAIQRMVTDLKISKDAATKALSRRKQQGRNSNEGDEIHLSDCNAKEHS